MSGELSAWVGEALQNAADNGYDFAGWSDESVAEDLQIYDDMCANAAYEDVLREVKKWRNSMLTPSR